MHSTSSTFSASSTCIPSPLWAACALPGDGPEYRFTASPHRYRLRYPLRSLRARIRVCRTSRKDVTR